MAASVQIPIVINILSNSGAGVDGNPRVYNAVVDIGCYEYVPEPGSVLGLAVAVGILGRAIRLRRQC
jgi:hypothetical protein